MLPRATSSRMTYWPISGVFATLVVFARPVERVERVAGAAQCGMDAEQCEEVVVVLDHLVGGAVGDVDDQQVPVPCCAGVPLDTGPRRNRELAPVGVRVPQRVDRHVVEADLSRVDDVDGHAAPRPLPDTAGREFTLGRPAGRARRSRLGGTGVDRQAVDAGRVEEVAGREDRAAADPRRGRCGPKARRPRCRWSGCRWRCRCWRRGAGRGRSGRRATVVGAAGLRTWRSTGLPIGSVGGSATAVHAPATIAVVPSTAAQRVVRRSVAPTA